jgi:alkanesulfonate monooxygenase SsuD/methylene tetrahydromethanopterin reductase-like flavin-dependent oxidoreductase (luciferase family)
VLRRVVAHADGWLPNRITPAEVETSRGELDRLAKQAGRDPKSITISIYGQPPDRTLVQSLLNAGADRVVVRPEHVNTEAEMGEQLERMAAAVL